VKNVVPEREVGAKSRDPGRHRGREPSPQWSSAKPTISPKAHVTRSRSSESGPKIERKFSRGFPGRMPRAIARKGSHVVR
jgi:hypothetical protein